MPRPEKPDFRHYLKSLPDEMLGSVARDYIWLASWLNQEPCRTDLERKRDACRDECARRGDLGLYTLAEVEAAEWLENVESTYRLRFVN